MSQRTLVTRRGWVLLAVAFALATVGLLVRLQELLPVAVAAVVLLAASAVWTRLRPWQMATERRLLTPRIPVGAVASVELAVGNVHRRRSPLIRARDNFDGGRRVAVFSVAPLGPGEHVQAVYRLSGSKRGVFTLGPIEVALTDPFGLVRAVRRDPTLSQLVVHPVVERLASLPAPGLDDRSGTSGVALVGPRSDEFFALRQYRSGDDLRQVHWASSARTGDLMIRSDQTVRKGRVTVVVDLRAGVHDADSPDAALGAAASLADAAVRAGAPVRVLTTDGVDSGEGLSPAHVGLVLDLLASLRVDGSVSASGGAGSRPRPGVVGGLGPSVRSVGDASLVVVTTEAVADVDLTAFGRLGASASPPIVVMVGLREGAEGGGAGFAPAGGREVDGQRDGPRLTPAARRAVPGHVVWVPAGTSFAAAWERGMQAARAAGGGVVAG